MRRPLFALGLLLPLLAPLSALAQMVPCGQYRISNELMTTDSLTAAQARQKVRIVLEIKTSRGWLANLPVELKYGQEAAQAIQFPPDASCRTTYRIKADGAPEAELQADFCTIKRIRLLPDRVEAVADPDGKFCPAAS